MRNLSCTFTVSLGILWLLASLSGQSASAQQDTLVIPQISRYTHSWSSYSHTGITWWNKLLPLAVRALKKNEHWHRLAFWYSLNQNNFQSHIMHHQILWYFSLQYYRTEDSWQCDWMCSRCVITFRVKWTLKCVLKGWSDHMRTWQRNVCNLHL